LLKAPADPVATDTALQLYDDVRTMTWRLLHPKT